MPNVKEARTLSMALLVGRSLDTLKRMPSTYMAKRNWVLLLTSAGCSDAHYELIVIVLIQSQSLQG